MNRVEEVSHLVLSPPDIAFLLLSPDLPSKRERESIFTSPLSSQCKMPTPLPLLLETDFVMHSANGDAKMGLPLIVGVSLSLNICALLIITKRNRSILI